MSTNQYLTFNLRMFEIDVHDWS